MYLKIVRLYDKMNTIFQKRRKVRERMVKRKDIVFTGFALFAMLFGAGNLIFLRC